MNNVEKLATVRRGMSIIRNHSTPMVNPTSGNVGKHTANILHLLFEYADDEAVTIDVVKHVLYHDSVGESVTGDIRGSAKKRWPVLKEVTEEIEHEIMEEYDFEEISLTEKEKTMIMLADRADLVLEMLEQFSMGNRTIEVEHMINSVYDEISVSTRDDGHIGKFATKLIDTIDEYAERVNFQ